MKILYTGLRYNYGKKEEGDSYEFCNLQAGLHDCAKRGMFELDIWNTDVNNDINMLLDKVLRNQIDLIFNVAFNDTFDLPEQIAKLALKKDIPVLEWHCDTSWRYQDFTRNRKDRVSYFVTTHPRTMQWFKADGLKAIYSQWAGSPLYIREDCEKIYPVSFIGQRHGIRPQIVAALEQSGIECHLFGQYWDGYKNWHGYLPNIIPDVVNIFNQTTINFNFSNPWHVGTMPQIKGRHFEIPQVGGFQISTPADGLDQYFIFDKEIIITNSLQELIDKCKYYLDHAQEREIIANASYDRMQKEHQWHHRFEKILKEIGLF